MSESSNLPVPVSHQAVPSSHQPLTCEQAEVMEELRVLPSMSHELAIRRIQQQKSLHLLMSGESVSEMADQLKISRTTVYYWLKHDAAFSYAVRAWHERVRREARNQLSTLTGDAVRVLRNAVVRGSLPAALAVLKSQGVLEHKPNRRAISAARNAKGKLLLEHEHSRTVVTMEVPTESERLPSPASDARAEQAPGSD